MHQLTRAGAVAAAVVALVSPVAGAEEVAAPSPEGVRVESRVHRLAYAGAGAFLLGGVGMSVLANQQASVANGSADARTYEREVAKARASAASATALYALAGTTLLYALVLEILPQESAERAGLTFRF